jgi:hypothetical protein
LRFEHVAVVDAPIDRVFWLTQDYARRLSWDPFLRRAELVGGAVAPGVGVRVWCVSRIGLGMETEYVSFAPPHLTAVKMTRGPRLLERFGGTWEFASIEGARTRVTFRYFLSVRPPWMNGLLEPVARRWFSWETQRRVRALAKFLGAPDGRADFANPG